MHAWPSEHLIQCASNMRIKSAQAARPIVEQRQNLSWSCLVAWWRRPAARSARSAEVLRARC